MKACISALQECTDPCCDALRCDLAEGAQCDKGECCKDCKVMECDNHPNAQGKHGIYLFISITSVLSVPLQFIRFTKQCRAQAGQCDLPEYCMGSSADCPEDTFLQDGSPCSNNTGYCFNGRCPNRVEQCKAEWGNGKASAAPSGHFHLYNCLQSDHSLLMGQGDYEK